MVGALYAVLWGKKKEQIERDRKANQEKQLYIENKEQPNCAEKQEALP